MRLCTALALILLSSSPSSAQTPVAVDAYSTSQHLLPHDPPANPTASGAVPVYGIVNLAVRINTAGHVTHIETLNGPAQLVGPANAAVKTWAYKPFEKDGKPVPITTIVTVTFLAPGQHEDAEVAAEYFPLMRACYAAWPGSDPAERAAACTRSADVADKFNPTTRFIERRSAYVYAADACMNNKQYKESLVYANKAVEVVKQGHDDGSGASAAYSVRAQAEAYAGDLPAADLDLTMAEQMQRDALEQMKSLHAEQRLLSDYVNSLKGMLTLHAQILTAEGNLAAAAGKEDEAAKL